MAEAEPRIKGQIAVIPGTKCELCDDKDIKWKCFTCEQYMCDHCKKIHQKVRTNREHRVTTIWGADSREDDVKESGEPKCSIHPDEDVTFFCKECDVLICSDCIVSGSHKNHTILKIKDAISEKQKELYAVIEESTHKLSEIEQNLNSVRVIGSNQTKDITKCRDNVKSKYTQLKAKLDQIFDEIFTKLEEVEKQNQESLKKTEQALQGDISELTGMINQCKEKQAEREAQLIQFVQNVKQKLKQLKSHTVPDSIQVPVFVSSDVDERKVKALFGDLVIDKVKIPSYEGPVTDMATKPTINVRVVSSVNMNKYTVAAVNDNTAWVTGGIYTKNDRTIQLVTSDGKVVKRVNIDIVYDLAVTKSGELLVTFVTSNKIMKLTSGERLVDLYVDPSDRCWLQGITATDSNDIIVCWYYRDKKEGQLVQLTSTGQLTTTIKYDTDGKTLFFVNPQNVSSNRNNDIIVADNGDKVVVVDKSGNRRFTYKGQVKGLKESFNPRCTVTDQYGHIIISDFNNSAVHLLDKDGNFIQFILSAEHGLQKPWGMSVDSAGRLWVCNFGNGKTMVVKYV